MAACRGVAREKLGGHGGDGKQLATGDILQVQQAVRDRPLDTRQIPEIDQMDYAQPAVLDFILGAQAEHFSGVSLFEFFNQSWTVDNRSDRMGHPSKRPNLEVCYQQFSVRRFSAGGRAGSAGWPTDCVTQRPPNHWWLPPDWAL